MNAPVSDISTRIYRRLMEDPRTKDHNHMIEISVERGIVSLSGTVPSPGIADAAEEIARNSEGVITVRNELKIGK